MTTLRTHRTATAPAMLLIAVAILTACSAAAPGSTAAPASAAPAASGSAIALPDGFPIGTWTTTITEEDLAAVSDEALASIGMNRDNLNSENTGVFTTTFAADGTWSTVQDTDQPVRWPVFRGTFTPVGDDAMDQVTTFPPDFAGDVVRFTWRTEAGQLRLAVPEPPDPVLGVVTEAHPWSPAG
jgi:hypothetical protein